MEDIICKHSHWRFNISIIIIVLAALNSQSSEDAGEKEEDLEPRMVGFKQDNR